MHEAARKSRQWAAFRVAAIDNLFAWFDKGWQRQLQRKGGGWRELELGETAEQQCMGEARERLVAARKLE